jgi:hypothetical protein
MESKFYDREEVKIDVMFNPVSTCRPIDASLSCLFLLLLASQRLRLMNRLRGNEAENPKFGKWSFTVSSLS